MTRFLSAALLAALLQPAAGVAAPFTLFVFESPAELARRADPGPDGAAYWREYAGFGARLAEAGVLRGGSALVPAAGLADGDRPLGGYFTLEVDGPEAAAHWADAAPASRRGGRVRVAAGVVSPAMAGQP